jgi:hypothetical protein
MVNSKNTADIEAFVAKNSEKDPEIIASMYGCSFFYGGIPNFDDIYTSLTNLSATNNTNTEVAQKIDNFTSIVQTVNETGILVDPDLVIVETLTPIIRARRCLKERALECLSLKLKKENASDFGPFCLLTFLE